MSDDIGFPKNYSVKKAKECLWSLIRPQVRRFAHIMETKFRLHDKERGDPYQNCSLEFLKARFEGEVKEFLECIDENKNLQNWEFEAADVGNTASMLVEWKRNSYKKGWGKLKSL